MRASIHIMKYHNRSEINPSMEQEKKRNRTKKSPLGRECEIHNQWVTMVKLKLDLYEEPRAS